MKRYLYHLLAIQEYRLIKQSTYIVKVCKPEYVRGLLTFVQNKKYEWLLLKCLQTILRR